MKTLTFETPRAVLDWLEADFADGAHITTPSGDSFYTAQPMVDRLTGDKAIGLSAQGLRVEKMFFFKVSEVVQQHPEPVEGITAENPVRRYLLKTPEGDYQISTSVPRTVSLQAREEKASIPHYYRLESHIEDAS